MSEPLYMIKTRHDSLLPSGIQVRLPPTELEGTRAFYLARVGNLGGSALGRGG
jgi:hypothetical protein